MIATIKPSLIKGIIQAPASKSSMQRACAAALLFKGESLIKNPGHSNDDKAALGVIRALGAQVVDLGDETLKIISGGIDPIEGVVNCGESGLGIRMFTPIIALSKKNITINGEGSLLGRPMNFFDEVLPDLGVEIISNKGKLPIKIKGPMIPGDIQIDGSLSSQFLTGLLMAYAASGAHNVSIKVNNLKSRPYIDLTLKVMRDFGMQVPENKNYEEFYFSEQKESSKTGPVHYTVEGDWSGAAFLLVAGAIAGKIIVKGLDIDSTQADRSVLNALKDANAQMNIGNDQIEIQPGGLKAFYFDATDCPDLFPPLAALASYCEGITKIKGVERLKYKESDRASTIEQELLKRSVDIKLDGDLMHISGKKDIPAAIADSHNDHRIAMMNSVIALGARGATILHHPNAVKKSYPDFFSDLKKLNADVEMQESSFADAFENFEQ